MASDNDGPQDNKKRESLAACGESSKKAKTETQKNANGETFFLLAPKRRLTVNSFKGKTFVDIREFYGDDNDKPGKKGISLPLEQYEKLKELIVGGEIDEAINSFSDD